MDAESQYVEDLKAEIERLKRHETQLRKWVLMTDSEQAVDLKELITELADALDAYGNGIVTMGWAKTQDIEPLIQRAREAVNE